MDNNVAKYTYKNTNAQRIGQRIQKIRKYRGISTKELAEKTGVDADRIRKYENGVRKPKIDMIENIADILDVSPLALLEPVTDDEIGIMYALFEMRQQNNIKPIKEADKCYIEIENKKLMTYIKEWYNIINNVNTEEKDIIEYEYHFPDIKIIDRNKRKRQLEEELEKIQNELKNL